LTGLERVVEKKAKWRRKREEKEVWLFPRRSISLEAVRVVIGWNITSCSAISLSLQLILPLPQFLDLISSRRSQRDGHDSRAGGDSGTRCVATLSSLPGNDSSPASPRSQVNLPPRPSRRTPLLHLRRCLPLPSFGSRRVCRRHLRPALPRPRQQADP